MKASRPCDQCCLAARYRLARGVGLRVEAALEPGQLILAGPQIPNGLRIRPRLLLGAGLLSWFDHVLCPVACCFPRGASYDLVGVLTQFVASYEGTITHAAPGAIGGSIEASLCGGNLRARLRLPFDQPGRFTSAISTGILRTRK